MAQFGIVDFEQPTPVLNQDHSLAGSGFVAYYVTIQTGLSTDQGARSFIVAGAQTLPPVDELWSSYKLGKRIAESDVDQFVEGLRRIGYVQIQELTALGLQY